MLPVRSMRYHPIMSPTKEHAIIYYHILHSYSKGVDVVLYVACPIYVMSLGLPR